MSTRISLTYCGMHGSGPTVKAAKADAAARIERYLDRPRDRVFGHKDLGVVVIRQDPTGAISYEHISYDEHGMARWGGSCCGSETKMEAVEKQVRRNFAQQTVDPTLAAFLLADDPEGRKDWRRYAAWQAAARHAISEHQLDSQGAHTWACHHDREFVDQIPDLDKPETWPEPNITHFTNTVEATLAALG